MNQLYHYTGLIVIWVVIAAACAAALFFTASLTMRAIRKSWIWRTRDVLRTWYYYEYKKTRRPDLSLLLHVKEMVLKRSLWIDPWKGWWLRFFGRWESVLRAESEFDKEEEE